MAYSKYGAKKTEIDGFIFDSMAEARRYSELKLLDKAGEIKDLILQPKFPCEIDGVKICTYIADFAYTDASGEQIVEDVKGYRTREYNLKKKLVLAIHGIKIIEIV